MKVTQEKARFSKARLDFPDHANCRPGEPERFLCCCEALTGAPAPLRERERDRVCVCVTTHKAPPFHGSRSSRVIKIQNASCQMGGREVAR